MKLSLFEDCTISNPRTPNLATNLANAPASGVEALERFEPLLRTYFESSFETPTPVQAASWPLIASGENVLITAPTGSGKTLTAFLWALNKFARRELTPGVTSILYVSPLKALNNDIQKNLLSPLAALQELASANTLSRGGRDADSFPKISVQTRSGDTPQGDRQRMLRRPPEILITTPESLSLLLTSIRGRQMLGHIDTVILDEIHSIVNNRRGVQLLCALERLCWMGIDPQRIALSATVNPLKEVAQQVAGFSSPGVRRNIEIVHANQQKAIDFQVKLPDGALDVAAQGKKIWEPLTDAFRERISTNASTLFFTNSRRLAEKITLKLNEQSAKPLAYAHHGSLSKDIRLAVEQKLKGGELRAIVATSSLEMGIDIGSLDEVVLIQSPPSVSASLQRIGRSGHRVGETSVGTLFPTHAHDFLEAAALSRAVHARDIEPLQLIENPLDLLAQLVIATTASEDWNVDELFEMLTRAAPYEKLRRDHFDGVIEMLAGRYEGTRLRDLRARISFDRLQNTIRATKGAVMAYYSSGGTIPDRGYFKLRHASTGQIIGDLDEEFVWEATIGQTFNLGTGHWQIQRITHDDVLVNPAPANVIAPPFWRSESVNRDFHFSSYIAQTLDDAERALKEHRGASFKADLMDESGFDEPAANALVDYLERQREHSGQLPGRNRLVLELINTGPAGYRSSGRERQLVMHTLWGARVNRPFGLALSNAWIERFGERPELQADNDAIIIQLTRDVAPEEIMSLVTVDNLHMHLREAIEDSDFFGARFRECAGRALLLTRKKFNQRLPLWMTRLQSKKLLTATKSLSDFPILLEAWRTCLEDEFDLPTLEQLLTEIQDGEVRFRMVETASPSPFAANLSWNQINQYMYADDTPEQRGRSNLDDDLITSAFADRPRVTKAVVIQFLEKRQRLHPDYVPEDDSEWLEWIKERVFLPAQDVPSSLHANTSLCQLVEGKQRWLCHAEHAQSLAAAYDLELRPKQSAAHTHKDPRSAQSFTKEFLSFYGPQSLDELEQLLPKAAFQLLSELEDIGDLRRGELIRDDAREMLCDTENFEILLRFQRRSSRPALTPKPLTDWPGWLAHWQNLGAASAEDALDYLRGYSAPVKVWLSELLPPRLSTDSTGALPHVFATQDLAWVGTGKERICIDYVEDLAAHVSHPDAESDSDSGPKDKHSALEERFRDKQARYPFTALLDAGTETADEFNEQLWSAAWQGAISSDSLDTLIVAERANYRLSGHSSSRRSRRVNWPGTWSLTGLSTEADHSPLDALEQLEEKKTRVRTLLDRYGVVCRELANREGGTYKWRNLFAALRVMELSGEIVAGAFFETFSGPQFATQAALREFVAPWTPRDAWVSALDPISPSGMALDWPDADLPHKRLGNHYALVAGKLELFSENNGSRLRFFNAPEAAATNTACQLMGALCETTPRIALKEINGEKPRKSPYLKVLEKHFAIQGDHKGVYLEASQSVHG